MSTTNEDRRTLIRLSLSREIFSTAMGDGVLLTPFLRGNSGGGEGNWFGDPAWLSQAGATPDPQGRGRAAPNTHTDSNGPAPQG